MTPEKIFNNFCLAHFNVPAFETKDESYSNLLDRSRLVVDTILGKHIPPAGTCGHYVGLVDSNEFNAFAAQDSGWFFIGINKGVYVILSNIAQRMLSSYKFLPNIGDPNLEDKNVAPANLLDLQRPFSESQPILPICPKRSVYAYVLFEDCMEFLILHELAHVVRGHVGLNSSKKSSNLLSEDAPAFHSSTGTLLRQSMEAHADYSAFQLCLINAISKHNVSGESDRIIEDDPCLDTVRKEFYGDLMLSLMRMTLAIYLVFKIFMPKKFDPTSLRIGTHPHPLVRQGLLMGVLKTTIDEKAPKLAANSGHIGNAAIRLTEDAISFIDGGDGSSPVPPIFVNNIGPLGDHIKVLMAGIDELRKSTTSSVWASIKD